MKTTFKPEYIREHKGCYTSEQVDALSFIKKPIITLEDIINSEIPFKDKIWFLWTQCDFGYDQRMECYDNSKKLQEIFSGWVFDTVRYYYDFSIYSVGLYKEKIILEEILTYSKTKSTNEKQN